jgi:hypothetical protein
MDKFVPIQILPGEKQKACTIGMICRGAYFIPLLVSPMYFHWWSIFNSWVFPLWGLVYASMRYLPQYLWVAQWQVPIAEFLSLAIFGGIIGLSIAL